MALTALLTVLVGCTVIAHSTHLHGEFGKQRFQIDVGFGDDDMTVTMHKPVNAPDNFRETSNLHIFSRHMFAMRNSRDRQCYVRFFVESEDKMKGRVENAAYNNGRMGNITEERLLLDGIPPLSTRTVNVLLGPRIASFCNGHDVYAISDEDIILLDPEDSNSEERVRRSVSAVDVAGICCCCCRCCCPCCGCTDNSTTTEATS